MSLLLTSSVCGSLTQLAVVRSPAVAQVAAKASAVIVTRPVGRPVTSNDAFVPGVTSNCWTTVRAPCAVSRKQLTSAGIAVSSSRTTPMSSGSAGLEAQPPTTPAAVTASINPRPTTVERSTRSHVTLLGQTK